MRNVLTPFLKPLLLPALLGAACTPEAFDGPESFDAPETSVESSAMTTITAPTSTVTFGAAADAEVSSASPNTNFGSSTSLGVDSDPLLHAYLRFDVGGLTGPVQSAKLRCYAKNGSVNGPALYRTGSNWTEQQVNWNNRPAPVGAALVDLGNVPHGTWVEVDVTSVVQANGRYDFVWTPTSSDSMICDSREAASRRPELVVSSAVDPSGPRQGEVLAWSDEFNGSALDTQVWTVQTGSENHSQSVYIQDGVRVRDGALAIRTRRHCVTGSEALTDSNARTGACPAGTTTRYSSGKVQSQHRFDSGRLEIRARLPAAQVGVGPAIWMRNEASFCATNHGGLDVMKWHGDAPAIARSTTQATCTSGTPRSITHTAQAQNSLSNDWHVWSVKFGPGGVQYELDGQVIHSEGGDSATAIDTASDFPGMTSSAFAAVMEQLWQLRFTTEVRKSGDANPAPSPTANFPEAQLLIDSVRFYVEDTDTAPPGWNLYWADEFDGTALDETSWRMYHNTYGDGNNELACLTPNNVSVRDGKLHIVSRRETVTCPSGSVRQFTSGFVGTRERGLYFPRFARYEMRGKVPHMNALWPAFWLRHRDGAAVAEVDVMEYFHASLPGKTSGTLHFNGVNNVAKGQTAFEAPTLNPGWHTWAVEIEPGTGNQICFRYFVDDVQMNFNGRQPGQPFCIADSGPFSRYPGQPLFDIALNMAVGGNWVGHPDGPLDRLSNGNYVDPTNVKPTSFPTEYVVDYVRVYTRN